jgi:rhodanese-related sulfurtransferase
MERIDASEFQNRYEAEGTSLRIIDVRTPMEYDEGHIPGAKLIDIMDPSFQELIEELPKDDTYYVVCRSGNRSASACRYMDSQGFSKTINVDGGMMDWEGETAEN